MRKYTQSFDSAVVDLDDPKTYAHLADNVRDLDNIMFMEIGRALCYMKYFYPEAWKRNPQKKRLNKMIKYFCENRMNNLDNVLWFQEQVFLIQDETENMC